MTFFYSENFYVDLFLFYFLHTTLPLYSLKGCFYKYMCVCIFLPKDKIGHSGFLASLHPIAALLVFGGKVSRMKLKKKPVQGEGADCCCVRVYQ